MGERKDIGQFFKDRLKEGKKSPKEDLWDKVNQSLDELAERKKSKRPYWLAFIGIPILLGLFLYFNFFKEEERNLQTPETNRLTESPISPSKQILNEQNDQASFSDSLENSEKLKEKIINFQTNTEHPSENSTPNSSEIVSKNNTEKPSKKSADIDETFTVTKKYYYYNSENDEKWITTDKHKIDSLLSQEKKNLDSIAIKKKDSLVD